VAVIDAALRTRDAERLFAVREPGEIVGHPGGIADWGRGIQR
jgi:hypothetical protein